MTLLEWRPEYSVGVEAVDHEHRQLIDLINRLHQELGADATRAGVVEFLAEIHARIAAHFALEERLMRAHRYDGYAEHKADHERLLDELRDIMDRYELAGEYSDAALAQALGTWFEVHFREQDARLHRRLSGAGR